MKNKQTTMKIKVLAWTGGEVHYQLEYSFLSAGQKLASEAKRAKVNTVVLFAN